MIRTEEELTNDLLELEDINKKLLVSVAEAKVKELETIVEAGYYLTPQQIRTYNHFKFVLEVLG